VERLAYSKFKENRIVNSAERIEKEKRKQKEFRSQKLGYISHANAFYLARKAKSVKSLTLSFPRKRESRNGD